MYLMWPRSGTRTCPRLGFIRSSHEAGEILRLLRVGARRTEPQGTCAGFGDNRALPFHPTVRTVQLLIGGLNIGTSGEYWADNVQEALAVKAEAGERW